MEILLKSNFCVTLLMMLIPPLQVTGEPIRFNLTGKRTWQSSNYSSDKWLSSAAIDGCYKSKLHDNCCTFTMKVLEPAWWSVYLGETVIVSSVKVYNRDAHRERLTQFTVLGSNTSEVGSSNSVECGYQHDQVNISYKLECKTPIMASYLVIEKKLRDTEDLNVLTLCEVELEVCPTNTYGKQCKKCGHCENPQCDWTSETGVCFGGCTAGYTEVNCNTVCPGDTYGIGCMDCPRSCKNSKCEKFLQEVHCTEGCSPGYTGIRCEQVCPGDTYGMGCMDCPRSCKNSKCEKFLQEVHCTEGCSPGYTGIRCEQECPPKTYGLGCVNCSINCKGSDCDKTSETLICSQGCEAGYKGSDCSQECEGDSYGLHCQPCSKNCKDGKCGKFSEIMKCTDGCIAGKTGQDCNEECSYNTFGHKCQACSSNCESLPCDKITGYCPEGKCTPGFSGLNCTQKCPFGTFGVKCLSECFPNCKDTCHHVDGACRAGCEDGWTGEKCEIKNSPGPNNGPGTSVIVLAVLLAILLMLCLGGIVLFLVKRHSKTPTDHNERELSNKGNTYKTALGDQAFGMSNTDFRAEAQYEDATMTEAEAGITSTNTYEKLHVEQTQDESQEVYQELQNP